MNKLHCSNARMIHIAANQQPFRRVGSPFDCRKCQESIKIATNELSSLVSGGEGKIANTSPFIRPSAYIAGVRFPL